MKATTKSIALALMSIVSIWGQEVEAQKKNVSVDDIYKYRAFYAIRPAELRATPDGNSYTLLTEYGQKIEQFSYATGKLEKTLLDLSTVRDGAPFNSIDGYEVSSTGDYILVYANIESIYRHSFSADYYVYDIAHNTLMPLTKDGGQQEAMFSPNGAMVSFVKDNNLHIYKIRYQSVSKVTTDGARNKVLNGIPDWVNEEEFSTSRSYEWSHDSKKIAYVKYDESEVAEYSFPMYCGSAPEYTDNKTYPGSYTYKYPKAGSANSKVSAHIYDVDTRTTKNVNLGNDDHYIPRIMWTGKENELAIVKLNRLQNNMDIIAVNANSLTSSILYNDKNKCYVDEPAYSQIKFFNAGSNFLVLSEKDGWNHLYLYENGMEKAKLTEGEWDVTELYCYNSKTNTVYFQAAKKSPMDREIYAINLKTMKTTSVAETPGTNEGEFENESSFFVKKHSSISQVPTYTICTTTGKEVRVIENNSSLQQKVNTFNIMPKEFYTFTTADNITLNGYMVRPKNFNPNIKYPVLMVQYSGPNSQRVLNEWGIDWEQILAGEGYIVACVDPRGTGARGETFRKCTYSQLGKLESDDQIEAANYLGSLPYIDKKRIGIWGWSFGGFMSSLCLCKSNVFKIGIAVAPVTNWRYYDTIYTERFLRLPQYNADGYDKNSPIYLADNLQGKLLLIHGTADDNVHYQNQMEMVDALIQANKQFDMFTYPNRNHSIYGGNVRNHLYNLMVNYIKNNL